MHTETYVNVSNGNSVCSSAKLALTALEEGHEARMPQD